MCHPLIPATVLVAFTLFPACADEEAAVPSRNADPQAVCLQGGPFIAWGEVPLENVQTGDAERITALRWEAHEGCERLVIDLASEDGRPAGNAGHLSPEVLRDLGVIRISLHDVEGVDPDATDATFDGSLAEAAYAVRSPDGRWTYVDVHLGEAAEAYVTTLGEPARVVVDLRPGGLPLPEPAATNLRVVVLEPRPGEAAYPLEVTGYARTFEANVVVRIEQNSEEMFEEFTTATDWVDAWGHFSLTVDAGPTGPITLHVGEYSARDDTWEGVAIALIMR